MTKEIDAVCSKDTLSRVDFKACLPQPLENLLQVLDVLPRWLGPHNDVINISFAKRKVSQNVVHLPLEIGGRIPHSKVGVQVLVAGKELMGMISG